MLCSLKAHIWCISIPLFFSKGSSEDFDGCRDTNSFFHVMSMCFSSLVDNMLSRRYVTFF